MGFFSGAWLAYENADDPRLDDGQVGGEDGEPRHGALR